MMACGGDDVDHEAVHGQQMGDAAARVAELAGGQDIDHRGLHGDRRQFTAAELPAALALRLAPVGKEVPGAALVHDVEQRPGRDQHDHDDHVGLKYGGGYGRRERGKRIAAEHCFSPPLEWQILSTGRARRPAAFIDRAE